MSLDPLPQLPRERNAGHCCNRKCDWSGTLSLANGLQETLLLSGVVSAVFGDSLECGDRPWQITRVSEFRGLFVLVEIPNTLECGTENELRGNRAATGTWRREET